VDNKFFTKTDEYLLGKYLDGGLGEASASLAFP